jgi:hypothetical protein
MKLESNNANLLYRRCEPLAACTDYYSLYMRVYCTLVLSLEKMSDIPKTMMAVRVYGKGKIPRNNYVVFVF